jgi:hypothetical protein
VDLRFVDGTSLVHNTILFVNGVLGFQRRCLTVAVPPNKHVESATVFAVATPVSSSFGTVFFDRVELHADDSSQCLSDAVSSSPSRAALLDDTASAFVVAKLGDDPAAWGGKDGGDRHVFRDNPHRVCVVLTLDLSEVEYVATLAELWQPPIVAVVYVPSKADADTEYRRIATTVAPFRNTKIVIVSAVAEATPSPLLPVNLMRNLGEDACPAPRTLHLEHGMLPSASLLGAVMRPQAFKSNTIYVLPSFLVPSNTPQLADKAALKTMVTKGEHVVPYQVGRHSLSYWSTNYTKWMDSQEPYGISLLVSGARVVQEMGISRDALAAVRPEEPNALIFNRHYSPVMIVPTKHVRWDTRFTHRSHAKASYLAECFLRKTQFVVLPDAFATIAESSATAPLSKSVELSNAYSLWRIYYSFLSEKMLLLSTESTDALYLRATPSSDPKVDHRVEVGVVLPG